MKIYIKKDFLKKFMLENNILIEDFSKRTSVTTQTVYSLIRNRKEPRQSTLFKIKNFCKEFGYKDEDIFDVVDE